MAEAQAVRRLNPYIGTFSVAAVLVATGKWEQAFAELRALAAANPDSAGPVVMTAQYHGQRKEYAQAFATLDAFLQRHPKSPAALHALGKTAGLSRQRLDDGERALRQLLADEEGTRAGGQSLGSVHWRLGMVLEARGRMGEARREYEIAARLQPLNPGIRRSLHGLERG
jgi:tetratricopeptide (TPR) repeat protein